MGRQNDAKPYLLSIEDPQDPTNDIAAKSFAFNRVRLALGAAYDLLEKRLFAFRSARDGQFSIKDGKFIAKSQYRRQDTSVRPSFTAGC